jgi:pimeloyl-ACP methyl ester carboxylesterase
MKRWTAAVGAISLVAGALLARAIEPGVTIDRVELPSGPALHVAPVGSAVRPTALLAHGVTASKETLVRLAEALAASGFDCLVVDFPGHGEARGSFGRDFQAVLVEGARALSGTNRVDVIAGHSMGAHVAASALDRRGVEARLLLAFGALVTCRTEVLHLDGRWDELLTPPPGAVVSPWSDHCLETWDPILVDAAVAASCAKVGLAPAPTTRWRLRVLGGLLVLSGVLLLLHALTPDRGGAFTGICVGLGAILWPALGLPLWFAGAPTRTHVLLQAVFALLAALASLGLARITTRLRARTARGAFPLLGLLLALSHLLAGNALFALLGAILAGVTGLAWGLGAFAETRAKSSAAGHAAFGVFLGYLLGQWFPLGI